MVPNYPMSIHVVNKWIVTIFYNIGLLTTLELLFCFLESYDMRNGVNTVM